MPRGESREPRPTEAWKAGSLLRRLGRRQGRVAVLSLPGREMRAGNRAPGCARTGEKRPRRSSADRRRAGISGSVAHFANQLTVSRMFSDEARNRPRQMEGSARPGSPHEWTDAEIAALVGDLELVHGGELTTAALLGIGPRVIPYVRDFLLNGAPRSVYQPRQRAVEVLGELGAKDVLIAYLLEEREIPDAVLQHAEDAVKSAAARELARWKTEDVF